MLGKYLSQRKSNTLCLTCVKSSMQEYHFHLEYFLCAGYLCGCSIQNERISVKRETWMSNCDQIRKRHKYFLMQCVWGEGSIYLLLMEKDIIFSRIFALKSIETGIDTPWCRYGRNHCDIGSYKLLSVREWYS